MSEDLETKTPPSLRDLELSRITPLMVDVALPGLTPGSTGGTQVSDGTSRLKELQERLQSRTPKSPASEGEPHTWRKQPVKSVVISNYKKNTEGKYHPQHKEDLTCAHCERRAAFNDAT